MGTLRGRGVTGIRDLEPGEIRDLLGVAADLKARLRAGGHPRPLEGRVLALLFEKPSLRTRVTFEVAMLQLGGHAIHLGAQEVGMGTRESYPDIARNLDRWVDGIAVRTFAQRVVTTLAEHARVPVINALSDWEHPCQALATFLTLQERYGRLEGLRVAWVGDGNNVLRSLLLGSAGRGLARALAPPPGRAPARKTVRWGQSAAGGTGATVEVTEPPARAVGNH